MEATLIATFINQLGAGVGIGVFVVVLVAIVINRRTSTQDYATRRRIDIEAETVKAEIDERKRTNDAIFALVDQLSKRSENDQRRAEEDRKSQIENNLTLKSAVSKIEGMMMIVADNTSMGKGLSLSFNDMEREFGIGMQILKKVEASTDSMPTDIIGEMGVQFGPVVDALKGIHTALDNLSKKVTENDADTAASFRNVIELIGKLEMVFLRALEPIVIKHLGIGEVANGQESLQSPNP